MKHVDDIIDDVIDRESANKTRPYTNDPSDSGGETCWGITVATARAAGYTGSMVLMPIEVARKIYFTQYIIKPSFDKVLLVSQAIACELIDTEVNLPPTKAATFLQRALNAFNKRGSLWGDLAVDGRIGDATIKALAAHLKHRGTEGEKVLLLALNAQQAAYYLERAEARPANEDFVYGWIKERCA